jgi:hypothetical protein
VKKVIRETKANLAKKEIRVKKVNLVLLEW